MTRRPRGPGRTPEELQAEVVAGRARDRSIRDRVREANPRAYVARLDAWAEERGYRPSARPGCGHGLTARATTGPNADQHAKLCVPAARTLLNHARLFTRDGRPALLICQVYAIPEGQPGHDAFTERLDRYVAAFDLAFVIGRGPALPLHNRETLPVLLGADASHLASLREVE